MKYILIIAVFIASCGQSKEQQERLQTEQILRNNKEAGKALIPLIKERDEKIRELISQGKEKEALSVSDKFKRQRDSIMRINY